MLDKAGPDLCNRSRDCVQLHLCVEHCGEATVGVGVFFYIVIVNTVSTCFPLYSYGRVYATADPYHHTIGPAATYSVGTMVSLFPVLLTVCGIMMNQGWCILTLLSLITHCMTQHLDIWMFNFTGDPFTPEYMYWTIHMNY